MHNLHRDIFPTDIIGYDRLKLYPQNDILGIRRWAPLKAIGGSADDVVLLKSLNTIKQRTVSSEFRVQCMVFNNADVDSFDSAKRQLATRR